MLRRPNDAPPAKSSGADSYSTSHDGSGRGFAVVAAEVKNLANQAKQATNKITSEIDAMNGISGEVVTALNAIRHEIQNAPAIPRRTW